ncbi:hypothetical protein [Alicyclobacillus sp. SP_1]|uniref:hypothetical protein n=1 Tax=Alicyclobacillus sp. SP_1 TaxID=2942475 RepID=UPI0021587890|nr:hypothetical protein [Alicyclobacillus sp. SP_1]
MRRWTPFLAGLLMTFLIGIASLANTPAAHAAFKDSILSVNPVVVNRGEAIKDVAVIGHNVVISGDVYEALLVVNGNVRLTPTARVGVLVDFGGTVETAPGAQVHAEYTVSWGSPFWNSVLLGSGLVLLVWAFRMAFSAALLAVPLLLSIVLGKWLDRPADVIAQSVRRTGAVGLLTALGTLAVSGVLAITILGLPVSAILLLCYGILGLAGWSTVSLWLGRILAHAFSYGDRPRWLQCIMGAAVLMAFISVPTAGVLLFLLSWLVGTGAVTIVLWQWFESRRERRSRKSS